jgi:hypothetical protein
MFSLVNLLIIGNIKHFIEWICEVPLHCDLKNKSVDFAGWNATCFRSLERKCEEPEK